MLIRLRENLYASCSREIVVRMLVPFFELFITFDLNEWVGHADTNATKSSRKNTRRIIVKSNTLLVVVRSYKLERKTSMQLTA